METIDIIQSCAETVFDELGSGFSESVYHSALLIELGECDVTCSTETTVPVYYKGHSVGRRRPDLFVEHEDESVVVELKAGSKSGSEQLSQYLTILEQNDNFDVDGGVLIRFNDKLDVVEKS